MASRIVNNYFHKNNGNEQRVLNSIVRESIKVQGREYFYLPRNSQVRDIILNEDVVSSFDLAIPLEMYMVDVMGYQGQKEMFTKFGLQINNSYRLVVSVDSWNREVKARFDGSALNGEASFTKANYIRPHEGDLVYDPLTRFLMEIKFVDHDESFYALGNNYVYYLSCEAFMFQNEPIRTSVPEIDLFGTLSADILEYQLLFEDGSAMAQEDGDFVVQETIPAPSRSIETNFITPSNTINTSIKNNPFDF